MDRATDFGSVGRGFESCRARQTEYGLLAQLVEQLTLNQRVVGSSPTEETENQRVISEKYNFLYLHTVCISSRRFCFEDFNVSCTKFEKNLDSTAKNTFHP